MISSLKVVVKLVSAGALLFAALVLIAQLLRNDNRAQKAAPSESRVVEMAARKHIDFDGSNVHQLPRIQREVDYAEGRGATWWPRGEAPILGTLVKEGHLPPVEQRTGPQPVVLSGVETGTGNYGGTWQRVSPSEGDVFHVEYRIANPGLFRWSPLGYPIVPHLATGLETSPDKREYVVRLREGVRWSDGSPFTADDIMFWWQYDDNNTSIGTGKPTRWMMSGGGATIVEKIDSHTVRFRFQEPYGNFPEILASYSQEMVRYAAHYWRRYHPDLADKAFLASEMRALGINNARALYNNRLKRWDNPEAPRLWPWVLGHSNPGQSYLFIRNPFYFAVDAAGNQLPYLDRLQFTIKSPQMMDAALAGGEVSMQGRNVRYKDYTELLSREVAQADAGGFKVYHWYPASRSNWLLHPNLNRRVDPLHPETGGKAALLADKRFRQALSLAIDRQAIIKAEYNGQVRPAQVEPGPHSPFHHQGLAQAYVEHDPGRAQALLDELGLTRRDVDGMRTLPDGSNLTLFLNFSAFTGLGPGEFVVEDWAKVGIRAVAKEMQRALFYTKRDAADFDFMVWSSESDMFPLIQPVLFAPPDTESLFAVKWGRWFSRGGLHRPEAVEGLPNAQGPEPGHPMRRAYESLLAAQRAPSQSEQVKAFQDALDVAAANLWTINIAEATPFLVVVNNDLHNVPHNALYSAVTRTPANAGVETYFFGHPPDAEPQDVRRALLDRPRLHRNTSQQQVHTVAAGYQARAPWELWLLAGVVMLLLAKFQPFIARRLLIAIPTLAVTSVLVFSVMRMPPGDFVTARLAVLSEAGESGAMREADDLRRTFHLDEPAWRQYLRWTGLLWFTTLDEADRGLAQGHLGLSMEHTTPVNQLIGDRIWVTLAISLASVLLSWLLALPIGVYSAVHQHAWPERICSIVCYVSMSVPSFFLALVLMTWIGKSGMASAAALPAGWSLAGVRGLIAEFWLPVVVGAVPGTAILIRVMKVNLLDELRKPYVVAARARGLRPMALLFRYPVRLALNPFVSGVGQLFPGMISGGAVVAVVLSLPTVGPLMISALLNQDQYLAGSLLMVLAALTVIGTLAADLLLLWLDPRVRSERRLA
ncbi:ABC transporter substrate-binding protein [Roseateles sp. DC23W]|uniref:ABC transporter substrate-binding protein n=1 Tax=Pelomonas dachongensis TaxID=3299029 RepID=A0ABW7EUX9_9BURK